MCVAAVLMPLPALQEIAVFGDPPDALCIGKVQADPALRELAVADGELIVVGIEPSEADTVAHSTRSRWAVRPGKGTEPAARNSQVLIRANASATIEEDPVRRYRRLVAEEEDVTDVYVSAVVNVQHRVAGGPSQTRVDPLPGLAEKFEGLPPSPRSRKAR